LDFINSFANGNKASDEDARTRILKSTKLEAIYSIRLVLFHMFIWMIFTYREGSMVISYIPLTSNFIMNLYAVMIQMLRAHLARRLEFQNIRGKTSLDEAGKSIPTVPPSSSTGSSPVVPGARRAKGGDNLWMKAWAEGESVWHEGMGIGEIIKNPLNPETNELNKVTLASFPREGVLRITTRDIQPVISLTRLADITDVRIDRLRSAIEFGILIPDIPKGEKAEDHHFTWNKVDGIKESFSLKSIEAIAKQLNKNHGTVKKAIKRLKIPLYVVRHGIRDDTYIGQEYIERIKNDIPDKVPAGLISKKQLADKLGSRQDYITYAPTFTRKHGDRTHSYYDANREDIRKAIQETERRKKLLTSRRAAKRLKVPLNRFNFWVRTKRKFGSRHIEPQLIFEVNNSRQNYFSRQHIDSFKDDVKPKVRVPKSALSGTDVARELGVWPSWLTDRIHDGTVIPDWTVPHGKRKRYFFRRGTLKYLFELKDIFRDSSNSILAGLLQLPFWNYVFHQLGAATSAANYSVEAAIFGGLGIGLPFAVASLLLSFVIPIVANASQGRLIISAKAAHRIGISHVKVTKAVKRKKLTPALHRKWEQGVSFLIEPSRIDEIRQVVSSPARKMKNEKRSGFGAKAEKAVRTRSIKKARRRVKLRRPLRIGDKIFHESMGIGYVKDILDKSVKVDPLRMISPLFALVQFEDGTTLRISSMYLTRLLPMKHLVVEGMLTGLEVMREIDAQSSNLSKAIRNARLTADLVIPRGRKRFTFFSPESIPEGYIKAADVARRFGLNPKVLQRAIRDGRIKSHRTLARKTKSPKYLFDAGRLTNVERQVMKNLSAYNPRRLTVDDVSDASRKPTSSPPAPHVRGGERNGSSPVRQVILESNSSSSNEDIMVREWAVGEYVWHEGMGLGKIIVSPYDQTTRNFSRTLSVRFNPKHGGKVNILFDHVVPIVTLTKLAEKNAD
jgi:hypothetical protein